MAEQDAAGTGNGNPSGATFANAIEAADHLRALREGAADDTDTDRQDPAPQSEAKAEDAPLPDLEGDAPAAAADDQADQTDGADADDESIDYNDLVNGPSDTEIAGDDEEKGAELTLQYAGQERRVTKTEAVDLAQKGLDYDVKMSAFGQEKAAFAQEKAEHQTQTEALHKEREDLATMISRYVDKLEPPDPAMAETDPDGYTAARAKYDAAVAQAQIDAKSLDEKREKDAKDRQVRINHAMEQHMIRLQKRIPDMKIEKTANEVGKYLVHGIGFTADDLFKLQRIHPADSRFLELAYKARKWDLAQAKQHKLRPKPSKVAATGGSGRAGAPKKSKTDAAIAKAQKTGKPADAVEAIRIARSS